MHLPRRSSKQGSRREALTGIAFVLPSVIGFAVFVLGPLVVALLLSFTQYDIINPPRWVGLANFARMVGDHRMAVTWGNTVIYVVAAVVLINGLGLAAAVFLNRKLPNAVRTVLRSVYFFPSLVGLAYVSIIWQALLQRDTGIVNYYLTLMGGSSVDWLNGTTAAMISVIVVDTWRNVGFTMLVYVSALQEVSVSLMEAAQLDGAGPWRIFRRITLPLISPAIFFNVTTVTIGAFQIYESVIVLTGGGPGDASRSIVMYLTEQAFHQYNMGYASAIGVSLFLIILALTAVQFMLRGKWVHHE